MSKTLKDFNLKKKRVLVRVDFNVPLTEEGNISDDFRIRKTLPTIKYLLTKKAKIILMHHIGRPNGKPDPKLKVDKIQDRLTDLLDLSVLKSPNCIGETVVKYTKEMNPGEILLLENLKFHKGETKGSQKFAKELAKLADIYINDAFGTSHHSYASIVEVPKLLPAGIGLLMEKETKALQKVLKSPEHPMTAIIGGAKVETKVKSMNKLLQVADHLLIGGLIEKEIKKKNISFSNPDKIIGSVDAVRKGEKELDIGPKTVQKFNRKIRKSKTILWAGPLGKIEEKKYCHGSLGVAQAIIESGAYSVVGGGDTIEFLNREKLTPEFDHASTGGGALLQYIADETLPGLEALK